ncbi:uncharacterized protein [Diabrotica undecimpunctata]|uniref:uncharacterized protein n=1 Tax=Diabrotica undecimpunctata TaxID=50387 RepID=UPI003B64217E
MVKIVVLLFTIGAFAAFTAAKKGPTECYHCSLLDGTHCNDPDLSKITKQSCSEIPTNKNTTSDVVCYTVTATWLGHPITERGCYYTEMEGEDLCSYFKRTEANVPFTYDYTCKLCYEDLCNDKPR